MPIEVAVWRLGDNLKRISMSPLDSEEKLENTLASNLSVLSSGLMLIGRQVATAYGKVVDLLAMDAEGNLSVVELKKQRIPRERGGGSCGRDRAGAAHRAADADGAG